MALIFGVLSRAPDFWKLSYGNRIVVSTGLNLTQGSSRMVAVV